MLVAFLFGVALSTTSTAAPREDLESLTTRFEQALDVAAKLGAIEAVSAALGRGEVELEPGVELLARGLKEEASAVQIAALEALENSEVPSLVLPYLLLACRDVASTDRKVKNEIGANKASKSKELPDLVASRIRLFSDLLVQIDLTRAFSKIGKVEAKDRKKLTKQLLDLELEVKEGLASSEALLLRAEDLFLVRGALIAQLGRIRDKRSVVALADLSKDMGVGQQTPMIADALLTLGDKKAVLEVTRIVGRYERQIELSEKVIKSQRPRKRRAGRFSARKETEQINALTAALEEEAEVLLRRLRVFAEQRGLKAPPTDLYPTNRWASWAGRLALPALERLGD